MENATVLREDMVVKDEHTSTIGPAMASIREIKREMILIEKILIASKKNNNPFKLFCIEYKLLLLYVAQLQQYAPISKTNITRERASSCEKVCVMFLAIQTFSLFRHV